MTKMPDKIYVCKCVGGSYRGEVVRQCHEDYETEYTRSDLIPQPVTTPCYMANRVLTEQEQKFLLEAHKNSLVEYRRMALSLGMTEVQPVTDEHPVVKQVEQALEEFKNGDVIREKYVTFTVTDEARVKALKMVGERIETVHHSTYHLSGIGDTEGLKQALEVLENFKTIKAALSQPTIPVQDELEALKAENQKLHDKIAYTEGKLSVYVEEYPKVVAERDDLSRAVVDFSYADELSSDVNRSHELSKLCDKHSKTIAKAKAVQDA